VCAGVGLAAGNTQFAALTERARRLNASLTGHRFLFGSIRVGGSDLAINPDAVAAAREEVDTLRTESTRSWRELLFNASFQDRLPDIGIVDSADAERLGVVGPAARAAGLAEDARSGSQRLSYNDLEPIVPRRAAGDVRARFEQRALELLQTFDLLEQLLDGPLRPATAQRATHERAIGIGRVESPRGATSCIVERNGNRVDRLRLRTGSYANWPAVAHAAVDNLLPDFPLINKSFELCYACADR
jgi:Ni,Fe-hydrogenase III large subunit